MASEFGITENDDYHPELLTLQESAHGSRKASMDWQAIPGMILMQTGGSDFVKYARQEWPELALPWDDVSKAIDNSCRATSFRLEFKSAKTGVNYSFRGLRLGIRW